MTRPLIEHGRRGDRLDGIPVIDAHAHVGSFNTIPTPGVDAQVAEMDRIGIDVAAISATVALYGDIVAGNDEVAAAVRRHPGRLIGYCHVSARFPEHMTSELERCFEVPGFRGIKVYQVGVGYDDPGFDPAWAFAQKHGLPVLAHTWGGNLTGLDEVAGRFPEVPFLLGHAGSAFAYDAYLSAARGHANLYLDLTYSREHTNMIEHFVQEVGAARVIWGSDAPTFSMSHQLGKVLFARIGDSDKRAILCENARRLFGPLPGLPPSPGEDT